MLSARLGLAGTFGGEPPLLPQPERFFAGGDYGPRGFPVDGLGPKLVGTDGQLYPTGGNAVVLGGAELRYNFSRAFQLASFLDNGNVFLEARNLALSRLRWSAGLGLRYRTPIGPVRLDWGYILDPHPATTGGPTSTSRSAMRSSSLALVAALVPGLALAQAAPPPAAGRRSSSASSRWWTSGRCSWATSAPSRPCAASPRSAAREAAIDERLMHVEAARLPQADVSPEEEDRALALLSRSGPPCARRCRSRTCGGSSGARSRSSSTWSSASGRRCA